MVRGSLDASKQLSGIYAGLQAKNPAPRELVIEGTEHVPLVDTPDEFIRALAEFLAEVWPPDCAGDRS